MKTTMSERLENQNRKERSQTCRNNVISGMLEFELATLTRFCMVKAAKTTSRAVYVRRLLVLLASRKGTITGLPAASLVLNFWGLLGLRLTQAIWIR
jgi:hypothetical protein